MINTSICFAFETVIIYIKHVMCTRKCVSWLLLFFFFLHENEKAVWLMRMKFACVTLSVGD